MTSGLRRGPCCPTSRTPRQSRAMVSSLGGTGLVGGGGGTGGGLLGGDRKRVPASEVAALVAAALTTCGGGGLTMYPCGGFEPDLLLGSALFKPRGGALYPNAL